MISLHTSPLAQPGSGDSGGMNVYVREMVSSLAQAGVECTTYTRADRAGLPAEVLVEPGHRVVHIEAGPYHLPKEALADILDEFTDGVLEHLQANGGTDVVHANYWLSGVVAHRLKHILDVPFVSTFHTLARVKAEGGDPEPIWRDRAEAEIITCADAICVSCSEEERQFRRLYGDPQGRIEIVAPGVEHAFFAPGDQAGARAALELPPDRPVLLFVGRIQPLKGPDVAIRALAALGRPDALLLVVGGASGAEGNGETARAHELVAELGLQEQVRFVPPQPHHILSTYYRAADVVLVPEPQRELRPRRPRGRGLRGAGRRQRGRRVADPRRRHRDRVPGARSRARRVRQGDRPHSRRAHTRVVDEHDVGGTREALHVELRGCPIATAVRRPQRQPARRLFMTDSSPSTVATLLAGPRRSHRCHSVP